MERGNPDSAPDGSTAPAAPAARAPSDGVPSWVDEQVHEIRVPFDVSEIATGTAAARLRREFTAWLAVDVAAGDLFDDLVLVVYEALANAVDHAYLHTTEPGPVRLLIHRSAVSIRITVSDDGTWCDASTAPTFRGRGLPLIRLLMDDVHIELAPSGTVVHLRSPLPRPTARLS